MTVTISNPASITHTTVRAHNNCSCAHSQPVLQEPQKAAPALADGRIDGEANGGL